MSKVSIFRDFRSASRSNAAPATTALVVAIIAGFVLLWVQPKVAPFLVFTTDDYFAVPWTFLSYSFADLSPLSVFFACLWLWGIGGVVERDLGMWKYLIVWFLFAVLSAVCVLVAAILLHKNTTMSGAWVPLTAITVIWGTRNPNAALTFMFVLPITGKWLAWISVAFVFFATRPEFAPFAAIPFILAYFFAANKLPFAPYSRSAVFGAPTKKWERYDKKYYQEVRNREKEREERERLRKLFEGSLNEDSDRESGS